MKFIYLYCGYTFWANEDHRNMYSTWAVDEKASLKKIQAWTGIDPMTSAIPVLSERSNQLSYQANWDLSQLLKWWSACFVIFRTALQPYLFFTYKTALSTRSLPLQGIIRYLYFFASTAFTTNYCFNRLVPHMSFRVICTPVISGGNAPIILTNGWNVS